MTTIDQLATAYHRSLALRWAATVLALPVLVPLQLARGLDLTQVALVMATFAAVTAVLEIPTGGLADAFGRVRVTLLADTLALIAHLAFMLAPGLEGLLAAAALAGAARALGSGALEAWYVDARRARDPQGDLQGPLARAGMIESLVLAGGTLAGGALPLASARPDRVARTAIAALARDPALVPLLAIGAALGAIVMSFESFLPAELRVRWGPHGVSMVLGVVMAVAFGATAAGQALAARLAAKAAGAPLARVVHGACVMAGGTALLALGPSGVGEASRTVAVALAAVGAWLAYLGLGLANPSLAAAFHARIASGERATMLSVQSLAAYTGGVAATLVLGVVAEAAGLVAVWLAVAAPAGGAGLTALAWRARGAVPEANDAPGRRPSTRPGPGAASSAR